MGANMRDGAAGRRALGCCYPCGVGNSVMLRKTTMIALATAALWSMVLPQSALAGCGVVPCSAGYGTYPPYPGPFPDPYSRAYFHGCGGCYVYRRPVLGLNGWQTRTVQVCD
jgi:hypothetical protein